MMNGWTTSSVRSLTQPAESQLPLVEVEELPFAVIDGSFSLQLSDFGQLADTLRSLHLHTEQQLMEALRGPGGHISLCPDQGREEGQQVPNHAHL